MFVLLLIYLCMYHDTYSAPTRHQRNPLGHMSWIHPVSLTMLLSLKNVFLCYKLKHLKLYILVENTSEQPDNNDVLFLNVPQASVL